MSALDEGIADWIIVTNGRLWRLYSRQAHARATNFYEVDLAEALTASGDTDPNEAFRYWWLFLRPAAFTPKAEGQGCWLDNILLGSREYAKRLGDRLKDRIFLSIKGMKEAIATKAGVAESEVAERLNQAYSAKETVLYDRLWHLFQAMDKGDPVLNVPTYNGGLFNASPDSSDRRDQRIARFLLEHKVPDRFLALAIDRLARDQDERTLGLVFIDYKSLEVRHLGSIYEGLLEFKLKVADEDLTTQADKKGETYVPLSQVQATARGRRRDAAVVVPRGQVYLSNDKFERKASGSYYTPDPIVEYIVAQTVGPVLDDKLDGLRAEFRKVRKTFDNELQKSKAHATPQVQTGQMDHRQWAGLQTYNHHKDLAEKLFDLKVLDPAMGSGHFLVEVVDFVTDRLLKFLNQFPINPVNVALDRTRQSILRSLGEQGVTVDPSKLTDINLLKRHVLKRCIYGVDLNPMAVELAKVSLWLDAFTLGAPLNFLDHHLRCGNSLIGATFAELEKETAGMFRLDYRSLLQAIKNVLLVSRIADATAAEVADSMSQYAEARRQLSGYKVVLDLLVARHFGMPDVVELVRHGQHIELEDRERFLTSLDDSERADVTRVEALAGRPDLRFFHWEAEFPDVFFGLRPGTQDHLEHRDRIQLGSAGFDCVVGNPPYVRQEAIKPVKAYLKTTYQTYDSTNDLYVYFQEMEVRNLRVHGHMGMIVANKWMRSGYGESVRDFLQRTGRPLEVIDFGHSPIFPDADTFPCILLMTKRARPLTEKEVPVDTETMAASEVPREHWHDRMSLGVFVATRRHHISTRLLRKEGWSLENPRIQSLLEKIRTTGLHLKEYAKAKPLRGILTGLNDAFTIDASTRDRLVRASGKSKDVIRPLLRGRDADRWRSRDGNTFLITIASSENADWPWSDAGSKAEEVFRKSYPAIYDHFLPFKNALIERQDQGRYYWELRSCDYMSEFDKPKIIWQEMAWFTRFSVDTHGRVLNNTAYILPSIDPFAVAVLNSPLAWWFMWRTAQHGKDEVLRLIHSYISEFPIPEIPESMLSGPCASMVSGLGECMGQIQGFANDTEREAEKKFAVAESDGKVVPWLPLDTETFVSRLLKLAGVKQPGPRLCQEIALFHVSHRQRQVELLTRQLELEKELAGLVEESYGLTPEERALLRSTRPVRDPLDVLEAKIRGGLNADRDGAAADE